MGTRADFYIGRGKDAEWIGSIAWDGYPEGNPKSVLHIDKTDNFRQVVGEILDDGDNGPTKPEEGWPWPWDDSATTDYAYAFDGGRVWVSSFGCEWHDPTAEIEREDLEDDAAEFPDMSARKNVKLGGPGSGLIIVGGI